jgi:hypothetical protein
LQTQSQIRDFFNLLSLYTFEELSSIEYEHVVSPKLKSLQESFEHDIEKLKIQSVGHKTRNALLNSIDNDVEFIIKGLAEESSLRTQTEYINQWISKSILCQNTVFSLGDYLQRLSSIFQTTWRRYIENEKDRRTFVEINQIYVLFHGAEIRDGNFANFELFAGIFVGYLDFGEIIFYD